MVGYFFGEDNSDRTMGIALIVFGVLFAPLVWVISRLLQKYINKSAKYITDETDEIYIFNDETLYIKQVSAKMQSEVTYAYDYLYKVTESATHYFLYISKMQCHIVPKNSVTEGDINTLTELLRRKLGNKFSIKRV
ncbi:MAG: YcxB family protein [Roseburia sp.]|nr:YcxB family protein [Roseburia sp.]